MAYMNGNLTRRLISGGGSSPECTPLRSGKACVKEVVTSNFRDIVLDDTKVRKKLVLIHVYPSSYNRHLPIHVK